MNRIFYWKDLEKLKRVLLSEWLTVTYVSDRTLNPIGKVYYYWEDTDDKILIVSFNTISSLKNPMIDTDEIDYVKFNHLSKYKIWI